VAFAATLAAALASIPAAVRIAEAGENLVMAWALLVAIALVPMLILVPIFRAAREGLRAWAGDGAREKIIAFALWLGAFVALLARFGALLRAKTHHHALAGVTFAIGALVIGVVLGLFAARGVQWARRGGVSPPVVTGLVGTTIIIALARAIPPALSPVARAAAVDAVGAFVALIVGASRTLETRRNLDKLGALALIFVILALFSGASLRAALPLAPLHDALTHILSALR
jgi:hypothetical protein